MLVLLLLSALMICDDEFHVATISHIIRLSFSKKDINFSFSFSEMRGLLIIIINKWVALGEKTLLKF